MCRGRVVVNPLLAWTEQDVWAVIRAYDLPTPDLYQQGFKRLGCICCPMQGTRGMIRDARRWPRYAAQYIRTFQHVCDGRRALGKQCTWQDGTELFYWWLLTAQSSHTRWDLAAVRDLARDWGWRTGRDFTRWVRAVKAKRAVDEDELVISDIDDQIPLIY